MSEREGMLISTCLLGIHLHEGVTPRKRPEFCHVGGPGEGAGNSTPGRGKGRYEAPKTRTMRAGSRPDPGAGHAAGTRARLGWSKQECKSPKVGVKVYI